MSSQPTILVFQPQQMQSPKTRSPYEPKAAPWPTKRTTRCLSVAVVFTMMMVLALYEHHVMPRKVERPSTAGGFHLYGSTPDAGSPPIPYVDSSARKSSGQAVFEMRE